MDLKEERNSSSDQKLPRCLFFFFFAVSYDAYSSTSVGCQQADSNLALSERKDTRLKIVLDANYVQHYCYVTRNWEFGSRLIRYS